MSGSTTPYPTWGQVTSLFASTCGHCNHAKVKVLHRCHGGHPHFSPVEVELNQPHQIHTDHQCTERHSRVDWGRYTLHQQGGDRNPLSLLGSGHDKVHGQLPSLPYHDDPSLVEQRLPATYWKTSPGVQPRCFEKDDYTHVPPTHPKLLDSHGVTSQPKTEESPRQCKDTEKHRGDMSAALLICLSCRAALSWCVLNELLEDLVSILDDQN